MNYIWDKNKEIVIFGAGNAGKELFERLDNNDYNIKYFIDNDSKKQGTKIKSKFVYLPEKILKEDTKKEVHVIVASIWFEEISEQLKGYGLKEEIDYSIWNDFRRYTEFSGVVEGVPENLITTKSRDEKGTLVIDKQNNKIYRVIRDNKIKQSKEILDLCNANNLFGEYLIETNILKDKNIINRKLVLEHKYIRALTYPSEWTSKMVKDAGMFYLKLLSKLNKIDLVLSDANIYNLTFYNGKFIWIDFGSIIKGRVNIKTIYEFINFYINTSIMFNKEDGKEKVLWSYPNELTYKDIQGYLSELDIRNYKNYIDKISSCIKNGYVEKQKLSVVIDILKEWLENIDISLSESTWEDYQDETFINLNESSMWSTKSKTIIEMIEKVDFETFLDIAGNAGFFCFVMANRNKKCILCDLDSNAITKAYEKIIKDKCTNITPVFMNFKRSYIQSKAIREEERFKSDLVMAIAIEHHLVFLEQMTFDDIVNRLYGFTKKYLLIEFTLPEYEIISAWMKKGEFSWYNYENFLSSINKKFKVLDTKKYSKDRILLMCERL